MAQAFLDLLPLGNQHLPQRLNKERFLFCCLCWHFRNVLVWSRTWIAWDAWNYAHISNLLHCADDSLGKAAEQQVSNSGNAECDHLEPAQPETCKSGQMQFRHHKVACSISGRLCSLRTTVVDGMRLSSMQWRCQRPFDAGDRHCVASKPRPQIETRA